MMVCLHPCRKFRALAQSTCVAGHSPVRDMIENFSGIGTLPESDREKCRSVINAYAVCVDICSTVICTAHKNGFPFYTKIIQHGLWNVLNDSLKYLHINLRIDIQQLTLQCIYLKVSDILNTTLVPTDIVVFHYIRVSKQKMAHTGPGKFHCYEASN